MFIQTWRQHWGLSEDPFACEDADKDRILAEIDTGAVHSGFDRLLGDPRSPAPGIVFGEKGSGKSGLRLMMRRRLERWNAEHSDEKVFLIEYVDFDLFLEELGRRTGALEKRDAAAAIVEAWTSDDHLDAILSLGVTRLTEGLLQGEIPTARLTELQRAELKVLVALYHRSRRLGASEALRRLAGPLKLRSLRPLRLWAVRVALSALALGLGLLPWLVPEVREAGWQRICWGGALALLAVTWLVAWLEKLARMRAARRAARSVRVLPQNVAPLVTALKGIAPRDRVAAGLPRQRGSRYDLLDRFLGLCGAFGFAGAYVLLDRIDEPSLISGRPEPMRSFVARLLDIKLLQYPRLGLKLFLPIELEELYRTASPDEMKRMRLDKSNLVAELKWTGEELVQIANQRLRARLTEGAPASSLTDLLAEDVGPEHLRQTLTALGTPRYAFGFLSELMQTWVRDLPEELEPEDPRWRVARSGFDVVRAGWLDRTGRLRRSLN